MSGMCFLCMYTGRKASDHPVKRTLHKFPKDANTKDQWLRFCDLDEKDDISRVRICSAHFPISDYVEPNAKQMGHRLTLKPGAVPSIRKPSVAATTIFDHDYCNKKNIFNEHESGIQEQQMNTDPTAPCEDALLEVKSEPLEVSFEEPVLCEYTPCHTPKKRKFAEPRFISEITTPDMATPRQAKRVLDLVRRVDERKSKTIKSLRNQNKYLLNKIQSLQELVNHLQGKG